MSLERTALRMALVMALTNAFAAPYPTIAQGLVYDSRIDPVQGFEKGEHVPHIVLYTDEDDGEALSNNNGGPPWRHSVQVVIDLTIGMYGTMTDADGNEIAGLMRIETEPALEAMLDLLEAQVHRVFAEPVSPWAQRLFTHHIDHIESWTSRRFVERDGHVRLAGRQIMARMQLMPQPATAIVGPDDPPPDPPVIPEPLGMLLEAVIADGGPAATDAEDLAAMLITHGGFAPLVLPPLEAIRIKESNSGGGNLTASGPARPDGVAEADLT